MVVKVDGKVLTGGASFQMRRLVANSKPSTLKRELDVIKERGYAKQDKEIKAQENAFKKSPEGRFQTFKEKYSASQEKKDWKRKEGRGERITKYLDKTINAIAAKKVVSRRVFKKDKQATVVYKGSGNKHFKEEWEQQGKFLSWK